MPRVPGWAQELSCGSPLHVWPGRHQSQHGAHSIMASATAGVGASDPRSSPRLATAPEPLQEAQPFFQESGLRLGGQRALRAPLRLLWHSAPADSPSELQNEGGVVGAPLPEFSGALWLCVDGGEGVALRAGVLGVHFV